MLGWRPWFAFVSIAVLACALPFTALPTQAEEPLSVSLEYSILAQPYMNSVRLTDMGLDTAIDADRDPSSPYYGTIYVIGSRRNDSNLTIMVWRSLNGGHIFGGPLVFVVCNADSNASCNSTRVDIAVGKHGVAYIAAGGLILRSVDQGISWQPVALFRNFGTSSFVVTDYESDAVYVATVNSSATVLVTSSRDNGSTWGAPVAVAGGAAMGLPSIPGDPSVAVPQIVALADSVLVGFLTGNSSQASVTVAASPDGGNTWPAINEISPRTLCYSASPSIAVSPTGIFVAAWNAPVNGAGCHPQDWTLGTFVSVSRDEGNSFSTPIEVSRYYGGERRGGFGGALVFDDRSRLFVAWHGLNETGRPSVYVAYTANLGGNFTDASFSAAPQGYGGNASTFEKLAAGTNGSVYLVWLDIRPSYEGGGSYFRGVAGEAPGDVSTGTQGTTGAPVDVEFVDPATGGVQARTSWTGSPFIFGELPPNVYEVWIRLGNQSARAGALPIVAWSSTAFAVRIERQGSPSFPWIPMAAVGGVALLAAAILGLQHARLSGEQILQRKVRLLLYESIRENPGSSFTEVRDAVGLQNGVAAYHLKVLEKQGLIHTEKGRRHRWYYPNGDVSLWRDLPLSSIQQAIVGAVRHAPGIGIRPLARVLNRHHASVAYNVKGLAREGLLRTQRVGRKVRCFPADGGVTE